ncbi:MAG: toll/interleukin-1 receptor domain-containing protein [Myxococcota bacterium]|nr:toll/interleukin-1 receptor domain-containing protein [Myxococcota bacterium]
MAATKPPLQLIAIRAAADDAAGEFAARLTDAFADGTEERDYVGGGEDLGVPLRVFDSRPSRAAADELDAAHHTVVVALVGTGLVADGAAISWLEDCWRAVDGDPDDDHEGPHAMLLVPLDDGARQALLDRSSALGGSQLQDLHEFGESALRPALLALRVLQMARERVSSALPPVQGGDCPGFLRLFISHAKGDGLPLAQSLRGLVREHDWMRAFYDADDIKPGTNWRKVLRRGVRTSVLVALRTSVYATRHWCRQEMAWADEYGVPVILVESRTGLLMPADDLPVRRSPTVRVPDGNLLRVLYLAMREGLRVQMFLRAVEQLQRDRVLPRDEEQLRVVPRRPSGASVLRACRGLGRSAAAAPPAGRRIVYPDPPLGADALAIAEAIVEKYAPGTRLTTPETLRAGGA